METGARGQMKTEMVVKYNIKDHMIGHICYINNDYLTKYRIIGITEIEKVIIKDLKTGEVKEVMMFRINQIFKRGKKGGF